MILIALSCLLFSIGLFGVLARKDTVAILASVEVMLGGPLLLLVGLGASARAALPTAGSIRVEGIALVVIVVIAAEAAVGLALLVSVAKRTRSTVLDELTEVNG